MKAKPIIAAAILAAGLSTAGATWLATRYPNMTAAESVAYVSQRATDILYRKLLAAQTPYDAQEAPALELANVREIALALEPGLSNMAPLPRALALRDLVYRKVPVKSPPVGFDYANLDRAVFLELTDDDFGDICGGLSIVYLALLKAFDIEARYAGMFQQATEAPDPVVSHASVEAMIDGRWIALDPTFNFSIWAEGERIGWEQARQRSLSGKSLTFASDGYAVLPARSVYDYPDPLPETMRFMIFAPSGGHPMRTLPPQWDGVIHYANGKTFDQRQGLSKNPVYVKLSE